MNEPRFAVTCWPCRAGRHSECPRIMQVSAGEAAGVHHCACTATGHPKAASATQPAQQGTSEAHSATQPGPATRPL